MSERPPSPEELLELTRRQAELLELQARRIDELQAEVSRLQAALEAALRQAKRQAAPLRRPDSPKPKPKKPGRKPGDEHGTHRRRTAPAQVDETHDAPLPASCPRCGCAELAPTGKATQYQSDVVCSVVHRRFVIHQGRCLRCRAKLRGRHPLQTADALGAAGCQLGPAAHALACWLNKHLGLAYGKVSELFRRAFGLPKSRGGAARSVLRTAGRATPAAGQARQDVAAAAVAVADETGWRVGGQGAWLHVVVGPTATCYLIDPTRSHTPAQRILGAGWSGTLIHDGWAAYGRLAAARHQQCIAHLLRRCSELKAVLRGRAVAWLSEVKALFRQALPRRRELAQAPGDLDGRLDGALGCWGRLNDLLKSRLAQPDLVRLAGHLRRHFWEWFRCLIHPHLDGTTWRAEQALRPAVVNRKVWGGNRTWRGASAQGTLLSVVRTLGQRGACALSWLRQALCSPTHVLLPSAR